MSFTSASCQQVVACPGCRHTEAVAVFSEVIKDRYRVLACRACGLAFVSPRPSAGELAELYGSDYHSNRDPAHGYTNYRELAEPHMRAMWHELSAMPWFADVNPRSLLDVGCATGAFMHEAQAAGFACTGLEITPKAAAVARDEFHLQVLQEDLSSASLEKASFGLVTMWHILEHLVDPKEAVSRVHQLLAAGGYFFIELPNWNSAGRYLRGTRWAQLKPPEHINFFTRSSLSSLLKAAGFTDVQTWTIYPMITDRAKVRSLSQPLYAAALLPNKLVCALGYGGLLRGIARRA